VEFRKFLDLIDAAVPRTLDVHLACIIRQKARIQASCVVESL